MHNKPGRAFELIIVDNECGNIHRAAINDICSTYQTVTHVIRNRLNEYHGGGVRQGVLLSDFDIIVQSADDLEYSPGWLDALVRPIETFGDERLIGAILKGHNVKSSIRGELQCGGENYVLRNRAAAYCYAFKRETIGTCGHWRRSHLADTRWVNIANEKGFLFVLPEKKYAHETNLNFLRPWDYKKERRKWAFDEKKRHILDAWSKEFKPLRSPYIPEKRYPLKNPDGEGPGSYSEEYLKEHGAYAGND